jgi:3D (Asp-Asp-Asp) domain-containing protein/peptidoglycan hydrolase CwlO-like protein
VLSFVKKSTFAMVAVLLSANLASPLLAQADSLDSLTQQEQTAKRQGEEISVSVQIALDDVNSKYAEVEAIKAKISESETVIQQTEAEITQTEEMIEQRKAVVAERMKEVQLNNPNKRNLHILLESSSLTEFISRAYAMTVLHQAERTKISSLDEEREKSVSLKAELEQTKNALEESRKALETEAASLDSKIGNLKQQLAENENTLSQIAKNKEAERTRLEREREEKERAEAERQAKAEREEAERKEAERKESERREAAQEAERKAAEEAETAASAETASEEPKNEPVSVPAQPENTPNDTGGQPSSGTTRMMESTAYSFAEPGMGHITATGLDLHVNPRVVAVDPRVIPLNTIVHVEGYGMAIAADTGGAIKGNIIDVHFTTIAECIAWGRRQVKVTIMN